MAKRTAKRDRRPRNGFPSTLGHWLIELRQLEAHSLVIVGVSRLDEQLRELIRVAARHPKVAEELLGDDRSLGSFSSRIKLAYALGYLDKTRYQQLTALRKIRNFAAHGSRTIKFSEPPISDHVLLLRGTLVGTEQGMRIRFAGACVTEAVFLELRIATLKAHARATRKLMRTPAATNRDASRLLRTIADIVTNAGSKNGRSLAKKNITNPSVGSSELQSGSTKPDVRDAPLFGQAAVTQT